MHFFLAGTALSNLRINATTVRDRMHKGKEWEGSGPYEDEVSLSKEDSNNGLGRKA
jgi:hypothetical protein